jgi:hypothetical protein
MEVSRIGANTPHRLHAIVRLVPKLSSRKREDILNLVQPPKLIGKNSQGRVDQNSASGLLSAAISLDLLQVDEDGSSYRLHETLLDKNSNIDDIEEFRLIMQERVSDPQSEHNPRFRRVTAWYAVQDERVFSYRSKYELANDYAVKIYERDFSEEEFGFNDTQYNGWLQWAEFLGWGWKMNLGIDRLIPNCAVRLKPLLPVLLPELNKELTMSEFMANIATLCVELDGGAEYERCWAESRPNESRSKRLGLMLSSGLRTLERRGEIELLTYDDSPDAWRLYPKEATPEAVTRIKRIKGARK